MGDDECQVQGSSTYIIKPWFDLARGKAPHFHLTEINQEAILSSMSAACEGSRRSRGSCFTNRCLHNSLSANRMQKSHALCARCFPHVAKLSYVFSSDLFVERFLGRVVVGFNDCSLLSSAGSLFLPLGSPPHSGPPSPSSALRCSLLLPLLLPVTALTVWLHVKAGAFCGSVTNLPGKTETICSGLGLRGDEGVNT